MDVQLRPRMDEAKQSGHEKKTQPHAEAEEHRQRRPFTIFRAQVVNEAIARLRPSVA